MITKEALDEARARGAQAARRPFSLATTCTRWRGSCPRLEALLPVR